MTRVPAPRNALDGVERFESELDAVRRRRALVASPAYCREPGCPVVVTVEHPLPAGYPSSTTCSRHTGTPRNRYAEFGGPFGDPQPLRTGTGDV